MRRATHLVSNYTQYTAELFGGPFFVARPHVVFWKGDFAMLGLVWGVVSGTQHWAMWSNGYWCTFKPTN